MKSRNANETILGYFYQFDKTIIEILKQTDDNNIITVEGIEDIDVEKANEVETIQCKYHEALEYNNSSIKKAIILLLRNYVNDKMIEICEEMLSGQVKIEPCESSKVTYCDYCNYSAICQFDTSIRDNKYKVIYCF